MTANQLLKFGEVAELLNRALDFDREVTDKQQEMLDEQINILGEIEKSQEPEDVLRHRLNEIIRKVRSIGLNS